MKERSLRRFQALVLRVRSGSFLGNVLILAGGTGLGQLLVVLFTPILTRIYTPDEFGVLTVFISVLGLLIIIASLRYEIAIPLPASPAVAINLVALSGLILTGMTALVAILVFFLGADLAKMLSVPQLIPYLWLIPLGMFTGAAFLVLSYWHIRTKRFKQLTEAKVSQSAAMVGGQLVMGWMQWGAVGLTGGYVLGRVVAGAFLFVSMVRQSRELFQAITLANLRSAASRYRRFPLISSWSALLNQGGLQAAPLLFAAFFGAQVAGWFGLAQRVAGIPLTLIGRSVSQVYLGEASRLRNENPAAMQALFLRTASKLFLYVGVPLVVGGLTAPWVFGFIFGDEWRTSGWYIVALLPMFLGQMVVTPLSQTLNILERQDLQLAWDVSRVVVVVSLIWTSNAIFALASLPTLALYGGAMFAMYVILFLMMWQQLLTLKTPSSTATFEKIMAVMETFATSIRRLLVSVFSFETVFVLYLFAGFYKSGWLFTWVPVDLTLFFLIVSVAAGGWVLWRSGFSVSRQALMLVLAMAAFSGWVLLSLFWAPRTRYGLEKAFQFAVLNGWALAGAALVMRGEEKRLIRFYHMVVLLAFLFSLETLRVYLPHQDVRSYLVMGASYQTVGRLVGLGFVIALACVFRWKKTSWQMWLYVGLSLLFYFVLLMVGARGPFLAAMIAMAMILALTRGRVRLKAFFVAGLAFIYLLGSLWMGPSLRTMYRINVILVHEIGWELPGARPTPTPALRPSPTLKPATPTAKPTREAKAPVAEPTTPAAAKAKPTPRPTPKPRIPKPEEIPNKSVELRRDRFYNAIQLWLTAPVIGAGAGSFAYHYPANQLRVYPHNMILEVLSELGVVGLILWLFLLGIAVWDFVKSGRWRWGLSVVALGFFVFTILNAMISGDIVSNRHVFTALGLLVATSDLWTKRS